MTLKNSSLRKKKLPPQSAGSTEWLDEERSSKSEEKQPEPTSPSSTSCDKASSSACMQPSTSNLTSIHLFKPSNTSNEQLNGKNNIKLVCV